MQVHQLSFAQIHMLDNGVVETIVNNDVEISRAMLEEWAAFLRTHAPSAPLMLITKQHPYSYSFAAQLKVGELDFVRAVAVVNASRLSNIASQSVLAVLPFGPPWPVQFFSERESAIAWLEKFKIGRG
jgi:hypothetical protein